MEGEEVKERELERQGVGLRALPLGVGLQALASGNGLPGISLPGIGVPGIALAIL